MITPDKIKVYDAFGGDEDGLARIGNQHQKDFFSDNDDWYHMKNIYQDIHFINNKLASSEYVWKAINKMEEQCDANAYEIFMSKIVQH